MSKKTWIIFAAVCVVLLGGLVYVSSKDRINLDNVDTNAVQKANEQSGGIGDHVYGKADSKVMLVEYGDFQCPGCRAAYGSVKSVTEKYKEHLAFVFRNFPLSSLHPNARTAAAAAEAAGLQGKYWEMHDALYENQSAWENAAADKRTEIFADYATTLGLDIEKFKTDLISPEINKKINYDQAIGKKLGVSATPTFYLNGKKAESIYNNQGGIDQEKLDKAVREALEGAGIQLSKDE
ncbi:MAG TPA: DsbA family protein [Candidatus Saccharimonadales bacterium]|nr:DsbA family protein [Candidatus Saccharimonadales bacterium]